MEGVRTRVKCDTCHLPATVQYTFFVSGERCEVHFCERCAQKSEDLKKTRSEVERFRKKLESRVPMAKPIASAVPLDYRRDPPAGGSAAWFAAGWRSLLCAACGQRIEDTTGTFDLRTRSCPSCGVGSILFTWVDRFVQIIPDYAPPTMGEFIAHIRSLSTEESAIEFLSHLQDLFDALRET